MPRRFFELAVLARRSVARTTGGLTQLSFRVAFVFDLAYMGLGALGGAAVGRATTPDISTVRQPRLACADSSAPPLIRDLHEEPIPTPLEIRQPR